MLILGAAEFIGFYTIISSEDPVACFVVWYKGYYKCEGVYESFKSPVALSSHGIV